MSKNASKSCMQISNIIKDLQKYLKDMPQQIKRLYVEIVKIKGNTSYITIKPNEGKTKLQMMFSQKHICVCAQFEKNISRQYQFCVHIPRKPMWTKRASLICIIRI